MRDSRDGNLYRSAMDNREWTDGDGGRFGRVSVDVTTHARTPARSATWYREAARRDAVV